MPRKPKETPETRPAEPAADAKRITPVDIQQKEFRLAFRGYNERDVDQFLDEVTEEVARLHAETKRLREEVSFKRTAPLDRGMPGEADAIVREAREEAARIVGEAQARASIGGTPGAALTPAGLLGPFLAREREFLQSLAGLIQGHADAVKESIRRAREEFARSSEAGRSEEAAPAEHETEREAGPAPAEGLEPAAPKTTEEPPLSPAMDQAEPGAGTPSEPEDRPEEADEGGPAVKEPGAGEPPEERNRSNAAAAGASHPPREPLRPRELVMDLTDDATGPGTPQEPEPAGAVPRDREDRSLREFFWGED